MTLLTIVIPTRNNAQFLKPALESVLQQTFQDWILYVVDDGSTDETPQLVAEFTKRQPRIQLRHYADQRVAPMENWSRALRLATTEFVSIFHDDDIMQPTMLQREIDMLQAHPDMVMVCAQGPIIDEHGNLKHWPDGRIQIKPDNLNDDEDWYTDRVFTSEEASTTLAERVFVHASTAMLRREKALSIPLFNQRYPLLFDVEYWLRLAEIGSIGYVAGKLIHYRHRGQSMMAKAYVNGYNGSEGKSLIEEYLARKNWPLQQKEAERRRLARKHAQLAFTIARQFQSSGMTDLAEMQFRIACWFTHWAGDSIAPVLGRWLAYKYSSGRLMSLWFKVSAALETAGFLKKLPRLV